MGPRAGKNVKKMGPKKCLKTASRKTPEKKQDLFWLPALSMAAAICLKNRSSRLPVVQLLVSIILQHCGLTVRNIFVCSVFIVQFILT